MVTRRRAGLLLSVAAFLLLAGCGESPRPASPADLVVRDLVVGSRGPAQCPPTWSGDRPGPSRTTGPLVPEGATEALLCVYPLSDGPVLPLGDVHRLTSNVESIVEYLNGLRLTDEANVICPAYLSTEFIIVLGYRDRAPAVVTDRMCALDQAGQVRYGHDVKTITGFWGVTWNHP